jgi:prepilin-type N-terminal cleavage/methylation domain-containing protein
MAGFTLIELLITVTIISIIALIVINSYLEAIEKAKLARCLVEIRGIQAAVWEASDNGLDFIAAKEFWANSPYPGTKPGPYFYLLDGDANAGHGNDLDGVDEENPGESDPDEIPIVFAIVCDHDHKGLADYVYATDDLPPQIVGGRLGGEDPGYDRFIKWEDGGPGGGKDKK